MIEITCLICGFTIFIDEAAPSDPDFAEWGRYSAQCIECGEPYKHLERDGSWQGNWTDDRGRELEQLINEGVHDE